jgi:transcriptional regulator with XRE-family HTH domain
MYIMQAKSIAHRAIIRGMSSEFYGELLPTTGDRIKALREHKKLTQRELGRRLGVRNVYISQIESNARTPSRTLMKMLAFELGTSLAFLELEVDTAAPPKGVELEPIYFSPEADDLARIADKLPPWRRQELLAFANAMLATNEELAAASQSLGGEIQQRLRSAGRVIGDDAVRAIQAAVTAFFTGYAPGADATPVRGDDVAKGGNSNEVGGRNAAN